MKYLFCAIGLAWSLGLNAAPTTHLFSISTEIDKAKLYGYTLNITPKSANLVLDFNEETNRFDVKRTPLLISTTVPVMHASAGFSYNLRLLTNTSRCHTITDETEVSTQENFISLLIDDNLFTDTNPLIDQGLATSDANDTLSGVNILSLVSEEITHLMQTCSGEIEIEAELYL